MSTAKELLEERKKEKIDAFGLTAKTISGEEVKFEETPFDKFLLEDSLKFIKYASEIDNFKKKNESRKNKETGLFEVTVGDYASEYYIIATMLNRMTNMDYALKVSRNVSLMKDIIHTVNDNIVEKIMSMLRGPVSDTDSLTSSILSLLNRR